MSSKKFVIDKKILGQRIRLVRKENRLTQKDFAKIIGISQSHLCGIERGKVNISQLALSMIEAKLSINKHWLLTGEGPKYIEEQKRRIAEAGVTYFDTITQKILELLEGMTEERKREILRYIEKESLIDELLEKREKL